MKHHTYFGVIIHPREGLTGLKWWVKDERVGSLRADTLAGIKRLIKIRLKKL